MVMRAPQVAALLALVAIASCDSPARVKPWRHAPDPTTEAASQPGSKVLAEVPADSDVHAARDHTLRIHMDAEPGRLSPIVAPSLWARRITLGTIFEPLVRYVPPDAQGPGRFTPRLARSWQVAPGGLEILIELEPDVTFHDGRPMTSSDVQFTLDSVRDPRKGIDHLRPLLADVDTIELVDPHRLRLRLKKPDGWVLRALAEIPILPMHVYDGSLLAGGALVGTGPWKLGSNKGGIVHLVKNDKYWGGPVAISDVEFVYQPDAAVALTEAKRGDLDIVPALIPAHWPEQANAPGLTAGFKPLQLEPPRMRYLAFNAARAPLDDPRVRHALALLVDRRAIAKHVFGGLARPALWPIWPGGPVDGPEGAVPEFDPAAAGKLLDAAGWTDSDKDGIRDHDGKQLRLVLVGTEHAPPKDASAAAPKTEREYFVEAARRAGVVIEVKTGGDSFLDKRMTDSSYDLIEMSWGGMVDMDLSPLLASKSPRIDHALDELGAAWDPAQRTKLAPELAMGLAETWPLAGIVADAPQGLVARRLANVKVWDGWIDLSQLRFQAP
jgi:peptide/nickel transport system substrate-binding protein